MSEPAEDVEVDKDATSFKIDFNLEGHRIEVEGHQGLTANVYRLIVDGHKVDEVEKAMGTHVMRGELPGAGSGEARPLLIHLEGSLRNKTYLEFEGQRQELLKSWVA
ncbi:MAG: hypothetical protein M3417_10890 [Actinomycetota bacterium]|nr:hypothetical protein [Actinomycetota bacterium]